MSVAGIIRKNRLTSGAFLAQSLLPASPARPCFLNLLPMQLPPTRHTELPTNVVAFPVELAQPRLPLPVSPSEGRVSPPSMQAQLLEEAAKLVNDPQKLINIVSKRVRQLSQGHRPLVDPGPRIVFSDIALRELIAGKLTFTLPAAPNGDDPTTPRGGSH